MTVPVSVQQRIRVLDAHGMSWRSIAKEVGTGQLTRSRSTPGGEDCSPDRERPYRGRRRVIRSGRRWTGGCRRTGSCGKQWANAKRVYDSTTSRRATRARIGGLRKRWPVSVGGRSSASRRRIWSSSGIRRGAGRFRHGAGVGGDRVDVHCPVVTFPYSNMRYCVARPGERRMRVRGAAHGVRAHRRGPPDAGA